MASTAAPGAQDPASLIGGSWQALALHATAGLTAAARLRVAKAIDAAIALGAIEHAAGNSSLQDVERLGYVLKRKLEQLRDSPPPSDHLRLITEYQRGVREGKRQAEQRRDSDGSGTLLHAVMLLVGTGLGAWVTFLIMGAP